ncbi:FadR/GntR family transcriptional regulator [Brevibacillus fluminis]|uniref:FadR/GntR family transcriptional regulator n=1 Tax=Brevibacillus fluminis TaxID=511487 RepID=UPI003F8C05E0
MNFEKPVRSSLAKQVVTQLEQLIESGKWAVGMKIPAEPELVEQLGVSRNTVREALHALIHNGLLEARQGDGTYVRASTHFEAALLRRLRGSEIGDILEVRYSLERDIARLAAVRRTDEEVALLRDALSLRNERVDDREAFVAADFVFHIAMAAATHNPLLLELYKYMSEHVQKTIARVGSLELANVKDQKAIHADLLAAIEQQDPVAAEKAACSFIEALQEGWAAVNEPREE